MEESMKKGKKRKLRKNTGPQGGNYVNKVMESVPGLREMLSPGSLTLVTVLHDDWCGHFRGLPCDCDPDTVVQPIAKPNLD